MYYGQVSVNRFWPEIPLCSGLEPVICCPPPPQHGPGMKRVRDFVADFAKAGKGFYRNKIKTAYSSILAPADFFLLKKAKMGAGRPKPGPGQLQELLGGGREISDRRQLCRHLWKLAGALQKVRLPPRRVLRKISRNKHPPSSNCCQIMYGFAFVCIHTSYIW